MDEVFAPSAFRMPISLVRSATDTSMIFITPIPPTRREIPATKTINAVTVSRMLPMAFAISIDCFAFMPGVQHLDSRLCHRVFILIFRKENI